MKRLLLTIFISLTISTTVTSANQVDTLVMSRLFNFMHQYEEDLDGFTTNVYAKHLFQVNKRNIGLLAIPSMYSISHGERTFVCEEYGRFTFKGIGEYENKRQVYCTTIPHNRRTMSVLFKYLTPKFYNVTIYDDHILSPFCKENGIYYQYRTVPLANHQVRLYFRPRIVRNTQLVRGKAIIDERTGRIEQVEMEGEFDMIKFQTLIMMGDKGARALLPKICQTNISFKFGGNNVSSQFEAVFDCPVTLPDSVDVEGDRLLMDSIRPISLSEDELLVYEDFDRKHGLLVDEEPEQKPDTLEVTLAWVKEDEQLQESSTRHHDYLKEIGWDIIGDKLINGIKSKSDKLNWRLYPIIDPQYISYSQSKGLSYRIKLGAQYRFSENAWLNFNPHAGYNFKYREFYYCVPISLQYNHKLDAGVDLIFGNDHRIGSSVILDEIKKERGDLPELENMNLNLFDDNYIRLHHHIQPKKWLRVETGLVYHYRTALNASAMRNYGKESSYYSLAPSLTLNLRPWEKAPMLSLDYERGVKVNHKYINYERWEADLSHKHQLCRTQMLNLRLGGGLYTTKDNDFFMDFAHFHDNNLPGGWDDDWAGNFQLLDSRLYNESKYYLRGNISFETPLMVGFLVPVVGRYVERERLYLSTLSIQHTRQYSEFGYGFTCRYFSMGLFSSFLNFDYQEMGCKFTFELFGRW
jgi:hypothetical protein